jgi:tetratricopeptide (TPR) repeat protein
LLLVLLGVVSLLVRTALSFRANARTAPQQRTLAFSTLLSTEFCVVMMFGFYHPFAVLMPDSVETGIASGATIAGFVTLPFYIVHMVHVLRGVSRRQPDLVITWNKQGVALYYLKRYDEALAAFDQAAAIDPDFAGTWTYRGTTLSALGRYPEALAAYEKGFPWQTSQAFAFDPEDFKGLIQALRAAGWTTEAEAAERRAKELGG